MLTLYSALSESLLFGEDQGFSIDATVANGRVSVKDTGTPANNLSNVAINSSNLVQASTSAKWVPWNDNQVRQIAAGQVAQEYDVNAGKFCILIEPAATNLIIKSQVFSFTGTGWENTGSTSVTDNAATAPDGTTTACSVLINTANTGHGIFSDAMTTTASANYTGSAYFKYNGSTQYVTLSVTGNGSTQWYAATYDLVNGTVTKTGAGALGVYVSSSITSIGNGWYRCSVTGNQTDTSSFLTPIFNDNTSAGNPTYIGFGVEQFVGNGTDTFLIWGAQTESGNYLTSYIPTTGATATRAIDDVSALGSTIPSFSALGQWVQAKVPVASGGNIIWGGSSNTGSLEAAMFYTASDVHVYAVASGAAQANVVSPSTITANTIFKGAGRWSVNSFQVCANGGSLGAEDLSGSMPAPTKWRLANSPDTGDPTVVPTRIYQAVMVPRAYSDTELQSLSA